MRSGIRLNLRKKRHPARLRDEAGSRGFRPDVEGLRAVAIVAVLLCHAGVPFLAGGYVGVDVFFVISGFLITRLLLGEMQKRRTISLRDFYARRAKRLLPLSALVLATVGFLSIAIFSPLRATETSGDIISSALYFANWHFAAQSVDYFAQGLEPSPVLHLWSLAIEEQFYLVWPGLMLAVTWWFRRRGRPVKPVLAVTVVLIFAASLAAGIVLTRETPAAAYFSTFGRAWELALGAMLALLGSVGLRRGAALALGWMGLAAIAAACVAFSATTPFPGAAALLPTLGAAALILAGSSVHAGEAGVAWLLSRAPVRHVGRVSYSWYLWHWPLLVFAAALWGPLSVGAGLAVVAIAWLPSVLTHLLLEDPVRRARSLARLPNRALLVGAGCTAVAVLSGVLVAGTQPSFRTASVADVKGAAALPEEPQPQKTAKAVRPDPLRARADRSRAFYDGCLVGIEGTNSNRCLYGDPDGSRTLILFGDSHAMQYFPPLEALAEEHHWRLIMLTKAECTPGEVKIRSMVADREYSQCDIWRESALQRIESGAGDSVTVVMSGDTAYTAYDEHGRELSGADNANALQKGYEKTLKRIHRVGSHTVVIRDTPASSHDVPSCVSEDLEDLDSCAFKRPREWNREFDARAAEATPGTHLIDLTSEICPGDLCRAVIGNALVYRDKSHLTATFARTLQPWIESGLAEAGLS